MRQRLLLFIVSCLLGGAGGLLGSIAGSSAGKTGLFAGGVVGGLLGASSVGFIARARGWISGDSAVRTSVGAAIGFLVAVVIVTQTLRSPIGPILSTGLIGLGALVGAGRGPMKN